MTMFARRPRLRWLVPLVAVGALTTAGSVVAALSATARDSLPARTASQLLVDVQNARVEGLSGTVVQSADLGIPSLPGIAGDQSSSFSSLVSGSHTLRVWYAGPDKARVAVLGQLGESDFVRDGTNAWIWSSQDNTARHLSLPAHTDRAHQPSAASQQPMTPQQAADAALNALTPTTRVSTDPTAEVAGRSAYQLVLEPRDTATLISAVKIAIDGATHIPTRVQVFARTMSEPAFEIGFTSFDPTTPSSSVFRFNPPPGATVKEGVVDPRGARESLPRNDSAKPEVLGTGWTTVVEATLPAASGGGDSSDPLAMVARVERSLPRVSGSWGSGHLLRGTLFSVLLTDDGRVVAGAVPPTGLYAALAHQ